MPVSAWLFTAAATLFFLNWFPPTGIYMMFILLPLLTGPLIVAGIIVLFFEARSGRVDRWLMAIPVSLAIGYFGLVASEWLRLPFLGSALGLQPVTAKVKFDPAVHGIDGNVSASVLLAKYDMPWLDYTFGGNWQRWEIGKTRTCESKSNGPAEEGVPFAVTRGSLGRTFCYLISSAPPPPSPINVRSSGGYKDALGLRPLVGKLSVQMDGEEIGAIATADIHLLTPLPLFMLGCAMNMGPGPDCQLNFLRIPVQAWPFLSNDTTTDQVARLLSLRPRTNEELDALTRIP